MHVIYATFTFRRFKYLISPFYFCILLFYLFFEVFFSFFRKLIKEKASPLNPDGKHLHMLLYKILLKKNNDKLKSNYYVSIIINLIYLILTIPAIFMMKNGLFCKYYSLVFFVTYVFVNELKIRFDHLHGCSTMWVVVWRFRVVVSWFWDRCWLHFWWVLMSFVEVFIDRLEPRNLMTLTRD